MENLFSSCLRSIQYDDDCDKEIAEIKKLLEPVSFLTSFANSILKVNCESKATAVMGLSIADNILCLFYTWYNGCVNW